MREGAVFPVTENPRDLGNRQAGVRQILFGKLAPEVFQNLRECQTFQGEPAGESSLAETEPTGNFARPRLPMRQQWDNGILYLRSERASVDRPP